MLALLPMRILCWLALPLLLAACSNGRGSIAEQQSEEARESFSVGGTVTGLVGSGLVLHDNGGGDLAISANGDYSFPGVIATGAAYNVAVRTQPTSPSQTCAVANGSGVMGSADITNVQVTCTSGRFSVGGAVAGLLGAGLVLQNNGGADLAIAANGSFVFHDRLAGGAAYNVTVKSQPTGPAQNCVVRNATGAIANANVNDVAVSCESNLFTIGGVASGLVGSGLVLQLNDANDLKVAAGGSFTFEVAVPSGTAYVVSVRTQPSNPSQVCTIANAAGAVTRSNATNVAVTCKTDAFSIGGVVSGLGGSGLVLQLNGGDDLAIASNGSFTFGARLDSGAHYRVTVSTQPANPPQACTVAHASGTVGGGDVNSVRVTCATNTFSVGGEVGGLLGSGLILQNSGDDDVSVNANGAFTFRRRLASGATYSVTVRTQPSNPTQACTVANGAGTVGSSNVTTVAVSCSMSDFTVGGRVNGMSGSGLVLLNNGADDLTINANGNFSFAAALPSGAPYHVTIATQPTNPGQTCTLENAAGVVGGNVTNVTVNCVESGFTIGGHVARLSGSGLVLQNNGGDDLAVASNGRFTFANALPRGAAYNVTVAVQPKNPAQTCAVENGSGIVRDEKVKNVRVSCTKHSD